MTQTNWIPSDLGLYDVSDRAKLGLKGRNSAAWLERQGLQPPASVYGVTTLDAGGLLIRNGTYEYFLESGPPSEVDQKVDAVTALAEALGAGGDGAYRVDRQDAAFALLGDRAIEVLGQTCGVDFRKAPDRTLIYSRVAGVSAAILPLSPRVAGDRYQHRLWIDPSFGHALWETLATIVEDVGGRVMLDAGELHRT